MTRGPFSTGVGLNDLPDKGGDRTGSLEARLDQGGLESRMPSSRYRGSLNLSSLVHAHERTVRVHSSGIAVKSRRFVFFNVLNALRSPLSKEKNICYAV
jgi:hypothetical protein